MTMALAPSAGGLSGAIQIDGVDKVIIGATGLANAVLVTSYANDAAAAAAGVPIGGFYHTTGTLKVRLA